MEVTDLYRQEQELIEEGRRLCDEYTKLGQELAEADKNYRLKKSQLTMRLVAQGEKVSIIPDIVRGHQECVEERYIMMIKQGRYKATVEKIMYNKLQLRVLEEELKREWGEYK